MSSRPNKIRKNNNNNKHSSGPTTPAASASASASATAGMASVVHRPAPAAVLSQAPAAVEEAPAVATAFDADTSRDGWHRDGSFRVAMSPRPHEIDEFGVVNNTYYNTFM